MAPGQERVPVQLTVGSDSMARYLTKEVSNMYWRRPEGTTALPELLELPPVKWVRRSHQPVLLYSGLGLLGLTGLIVLFMKTKTPSWICFMIPLGLVALFGAYRFAKLVPEFPDDKTANDLVFKLLRNTYHAFDFRDESDIYDVLGESVSGELLEEVYLQIRKSLELEVRGGPRVRIKGIVPRNCRVFQDQR